MRRFVRFSVSTSEAECDLASALVASIRALVDDFGNALVVSGAFADASTSSDLALEDRERSEDLCSGVKAGPDAIRRLLNLVEAAVEW